MPLERYAFSARATSSSRTRSKCSRNCTIPRLTRTASRIDSGFSTYGRRTIPYNPRLRRPGLADSSAIRRRPRRCGAHDTPSGAGRRSQKLLNQRCTPAPCTGTTNCPWTYAAAWTTPGNFTTNSDHQRLPDRRRLSKVTSMVGDNDWTGTFTPRTARGVKRRRPPKGSRFCRGPEPVDGADQYGLRLRVSALPGYSPVGGDGTLHVGPPDLR